MRTILSLAVLTTAIAAQSPLTTTFASNNGQSGNMFDLVAVNAAGVTIKNFDVNVDAGTWDFEVYVLTTPGTYAPSVNTAADWTLVGSATGVVSAGLNVPTLLPICVEEFIPANATQAFYVTVTNGTSMNYTNGTTTGALYTSNADLEHYEGAGLAYAFTANFNPRVWNGNIYYDIGDTTGTGCTFASVSPFGVACGGNPAGDAQYELFTAFDLANTGHTYLWTGNSYVLTDGAQPIIAPANAATAFGDDQTQTVALGFTMPTPQGSITDIALCSNGWLSFDSTVTAVDLGENVAGFLATFSRLAFLWDDLNPSAGGTINIEQFTGELRITYTDVPEFAATNANTVQVALFDTGVIEVRYGAVALLDCMVGVSPGSNANDLGGTDYSALAVAGPQIIQTNVGPFSASMDLTSTRPVLGTNWDFTTAGIDPVSPIVFVLLGDAAPVAIPLSAIGFNAPGCEVNLATIGGSLTGTPTGGAATVGLALPNNPALAGQQFSAQSLGFTLSNPANIWTSNALLGTLGN